MPVGLGSEHVMQAEKRNRFERARMELHFKLLEKEKANTVRDVNQSARQVRVEYMSVPMTTGQSTEGRAPAHRFDTQYKNCEYFRFGARISDKRLHKWRRDETRLQNFLTASHKSIKDSWIRLRQQNKIATQKNEDELQINTQKTPKEPRDPKEPILSRERPKVDIFDSLRDDKKPSNDEVTKVASANAYRDERKFSLKQWQKDVMEDYKSQITKKIKVSRKKRPESAPSSRVDDAPGDSAKQKVQENIKARPKSASVLSLKTSSSTDSVKNGPSDVALAQDVKKNDISKCTSNKAESKSNGNTVTKDDKSAENTDATSNVTPQQLPQENTKSIQNATNEMKMKPKSALKSSSSKVLTKSTDDVLEDIAEAVNGIELENNEDDPRDDHLTDDDIVYGCGKPPLQKRQTCPAFIHTPKQRPHTAVISKRRSSIGSDDSTGSGPRPRSAMIRRQVSFAIDYDSDVENIPDTSQQGPQQDSVEDSKVEPMVGNFFDLVKTIKTNDSEIEEQEAVTSPSTPGSNIRYKKEARTRSLRRMLSSTSSRSETEDEIVVEAEDKIEEIRRARRERIASRPRAKSLPNAKMELIKYNRIRREALKKNTLSKPKFGEDEDEEDGSVEDEEVEIQGAGGRRRSSQWRRNLLVEAPRAAQSKDDIKKELKRATVMSKSAKNRMMQDMVKEHMANKVKKYAHLAEEQQKLQERINSFNKLTMPS